MPYTKKEEKLMKELKKDYGAAKGEAVYHRMARQANGKYKNLFGAQTKKKGR